jgi:alpha-L-fucosidase
MDVNASAINGTEAGLEPWQFYGPSTRSGDVIYLICPWKPYEDVVVRGLPVKRVTARHLATGAELKVRARATAEQELFQQDPVGEVFISLPEELHEPHATVIELTLAP